MKQIFFGGTTDQPAANERIHPANYGVSWSSSNNNVQFRHGDAGTTRKFRIKLGTAPGVGNGYTFQFRKNGSATGAIDMVFGAADTDISSASGAIVMAEDDYISVFVSSITGTPDWSKISFAWEWEGDTSGLAIASACDGKTLASNTTRAIAAFSWVGNWFFSTGSGNAFTNSPADLTINSLKVILSAAEASDQTFSIFKNGVEEASSVFVIENPATSGEVSGLTIDVAPSDEIAIQGINAAGGSDSFPLSAFMTYTPDTDGESVIGGGTDNDLDNTATEYQSFLGSDRPTWGSEATHEGLMNGASGAPDWVLQDMRLLTENAAGGGNSYVFTARKNGADGNSTVTISGPAETEDVDTVNTDTIEPGDEGSLQVAPASTPNTGNCWWSAIQFIETGIDADEIMAALRTQGEQEPVQVPAEVVSYG